MVTSEGTEGGPGRDPGLRTGRGHAIGEGVTWAARWSLRLILVAVGAALIWWLIGALWSIVLPVLLAIVVATVLWPPTAALRRLKFPPALAAGIVLLLGMGVLALLIAVITTSISGSAPEIAESAVAGVGAIREWLAGPPFNIGDSQLNDLLAQATAQVQQSISTISTTAINSVAGVASGVVTALLTLVLAFLFIKDGPRFLPWLTTVAGSGAGGHMAEVGHRVWKTVGEFIRTQAIVSLCDAILIGAGLLILGVPLAIPLAVLTFLGGFVPIVGAIVAGVLGVLVALVSNWFTTALIVLVIILAVQQIEGNVLQPILQSRSLGLHSAVVLLAVTAGSTLYGIAGAFLAVPVTAAAAVVLRYLGERVDQRVAGGPAPSIAPPLETVGVVPGIPGQPTVDGEVTGPGGRPRDPDEQPPRPSPPDDPQPKPTSERSSEDSDEVSGGLFGGLLRRVRNRGDST